MFEKALASSMTYDDYKILVKEKVKENASTGNEQNEMLANFTKLNNSRMNRLDKTLTIKPNNEQIIAQISQKQVWLVLTESWCGDAAQILPVINKLAKLNNNIDLRIVLRDENDELMNAYLTNGSKSIPKLISFTHDMSSEIFNWGPRPMPAVALVNEWKEKNGSFTDEGKTALQNWYNDNHGEAMQDEICALVNRNI